MSAGLEVAKSIFGGGGKAAELRKKSRQKSKARKKKRIQDLELQLGGFGTPLARSSSIGGIQTGRSGSALTQTVGGTGLPMWLIGVVVAGIIWFMTKKK